MLREHDFDVDLLEFEGKTRQVVCVSRRSMMRRSVMRRCGVGTF